MTRFGQITRQCALGFHFSLKIVTKATELTDITTEHCPLSHCNLQTIALTISIQVFSMSKDLEVAEQLPTTR